MGQRGQWAQQSERLWVYQLAGYGHIVGYVVCRSQDGAHGSGWAAVIASDKGGRDTVLESGLPLDAARQAVERRATPAR